MKFIFQWLSSLKLTVWTLTILIGVFFLGAYLMPLYPKAHQGINAMPLLEWWTQFGKESSSVNFWLPASFLLITLLSLNTVICTLRYFSLGPSLWAHMTHVGFLLILLAHLVSATTGFKENGIVLPRGHTIEIPKLNVKLELNHIEITPYPGGMPKDYSVQIVFHSESGTEVKSLGPNRPAFHQGIPIYLKTFGYQPIPYAVCDIVHDPGARVALTGSVIFLIGSLPLPFLTRKSRGPETSDSGSGKALIRV